MSSSAKRCCDGPNMASQRKYVLASCDGGVLAGGWEHLMTKNAIKQGINYKMTIRSFFSQLDTKKDIPFLEQQ